MGGASKLLSSILLTSSPLRLRPSAAAAALFLSPPTAASRRLLLLSSPSPLRTLSTSSSAAAASSLPHGSSYASPAPPPRAPFPEWSRFVDRLAAAGYASRALCPSDELALASGCGLSDGAEAAVFSCLAFARDRPDLLRSLPRKDVEVLVANAAPALFKDGEASAQRLLRYLAGEESDDIVSERAETVDIVRYMLSYIYSSSDSNSEDKELTDSAVRNILAELVSFSGLSQSSSFVESTPRQTSSSQHERISRPPGQTIEMKRGDWICTRCSFMNFARNVRCLECNEHRPKKMLTGGEWECPQCEFYNYGRNMECLRCTCKRPATIPPNPASAGAGLGGVARLLNVTDVGKSEIERKLAENDEKAERWLSKVSQLDDSADLSSLAEDEDFPEIMPMRKGVNKFVVSTRKTSLERRLANAQYISNNSPQAASSDSKISQTLDRILGRSTSTAAPNNQSGAEAAKTEAPKKSMDHRGGTDPVPFVPLSADIFSKPHSSNGQTNENGQIQTEANSSTTNSPMPLPKRRDGNELLDTAEKWSNKVSDLGNVKDLPSAISDENFPEIMPMRKGENRFVISKKKDRSLTSPQYKRRSVVEQADDSNLVPFVPFPPGYFAKKDKPTESTPDAGIVSEGSPGAEKHPETNASSGKPGNSSNTSQMVGSQPKCNMENENWNRNYSQQNSSSGGYAYDDRNSCQHQPQSHEVPSRSSSTSNTGTWNTDYSQGTLNESRGGSTYNVTNYSRQPPYTSGHNNSDNSWSSGNSNSKNAWSSNSNHNNNNAWNSNNTYNNNSTLKGNSRYNNNTWSNDSNNNNDAWSSYSSNNQSGSFADNSSASSSSGTMNSDQTVRNSSFGGSSNRGYTGKGLEGSAVKDPDPLDMSEEAKAERWFRRAAQIKDISELANIPDEDFPEIMPMRKGVNRFVVSKRKTPLERRLTSPQYRRNLPIISSEPEKDAS
ncbi:zinc finger protein VAR3, chloroplastic-like [Phragmites australis]|uniref:zinc finger protein VAR3, chloroplastic-like n=1 Tax=Phragmites australis TaxID=29695 RepID=UPI002D7670B1|nr:zinc finger protein VAR3, chloroplastic-like [Phragmites australis]